jgi:FkbM family methyltransferase
MLPLRLRVIRPYLAGLIYSETPLPPLVEFLRYLVQPGKLRRASKYIRSTSADGEFVRICFEGFESRPFYYPVACRWVDFCQIVDECLNPDNWHHFFSKNIELSKDDIVVDCGAAEGLFTFIASAKAQKVFAIEPLPIFIQALKHNFQDVPNVTIFPYAIAHRASTAAMSEDEIFSRLDPTGVLEVQVTTIDSLFPENGDHVSLLKADIEGYEFPMLLGAEKTISRCRPRIAITAYHPQNNVSEIMDFLSALHPDYKFATKGISDCGHPTILQVW